MVKSKPTVRYTELETNSCEEEEEEEERALYSAHSSEDISTFQCQIGLIGATCNSGNKLGSSQHHLQWYHHILSTDLHGICHEVVLRSPA